MLKPQPQVPELEKSVLGILLDQWNLFDEVSDLLPSEEVFYIPGHQIIFEAIKRLYDSGLPADTLTVCNELEKSGKIEQAGGRYGIQQLVNAVTSAAPLKIHAIGVREAHMRRQQIAIGAELMKLGYDTTADIWDTFEKIEQKLFISQQISATKETQHIQAVANVVLKGIFEAKQADNALTGVDTGFRVFNEKTNGWQKTDLIIIAARPAVGKTAFALNLGMNAALSAIKSRTGAIFSLEMSAGQLAKRIISAKTGVPLSEINSPSHMGDLNYEKIAIWVSRAKSLGIHIDDTPAISIPQLRSKVRRLVKKFGIEWIIIDYLQLMSGGKNKGNREQEISQISRDLKQIAKEYEIPIIALSQLNRIEVWEEPTPLNLRESGAIEQDADLIFFLWNHSEAEIKEDGDLLNVKKAKCVKHRNGDNFIDLLRFDKDTQVFRDYEPHSFEYERPPDNPRAGMPSKVFIPGGFQTNPNKTHEPERHDPNDAEYWQPE